MTRSRALRAFTQTEGASQNVSRSMRRCLRCWLIAGLVCALAACRDKPALEHYGALPQFSLQNQYGDEFTHKDLAGRVVVVDFIFTSCPDVCPLLTEQLVALRKQMPSDARVSYLSISVDPEHDTPERLRAFAAAHGAVADDIWFVTGPFEQVKAVVTQGFKQAMELQPTGEGKPRNVLHGSHFVLVDTVGELRGFFPNDSEGHAALKRAAIALLSEPVVK